MLLGVTELVLGGPGGVAADGCCLLHLSGCVFSGMEAASRAFFVNRILLPLAAAYRIFR
jgi:hypothetical protein